MLTDAKLRSLKPKDAVYRVADSQGLCIEVRPSGSKIWRYRYRFAAKANMLSLGEYPGVTLAQARSERDKHRALVKAGSDPVQVGRIQRAAQMERAGNTFAVLADELMEKRAKKLTPGSVVRERRLLERDLGGFLETWLISLFGIFRPMMRSIPLRVVVRLLMPTRTPLAAFPCALAFSASSRSWFSSASSSLMVPVPDDGIDPPKSKRPAVEDLPML